jgi:hypothetical protein
MYRPHKKIALCWCRHKKIHEGIINMKRFSTMTQRTRVADSDGFNRVSGSGSVFGIRIRIQEGKNDPQK